MRLKYAEEGWWMNLGDVVDSATLSDHGDGAVRIILTRWAGDLEVVPLSD
jgi:hypothetical protein